MRLVSYYDRGVRVGALDPAGIWDLRAVLALHLARVAGEPAAAHRARQAVPADMAEFIHRQHGRMGRFRELVAACADDPGARDRYVAQGMLRSPGAVIALPPVLRPTKILCAARSYRDTPAGSTPAGGATVTAAAPPREVRMGFLKAPSALVAHGADVTGPADSRRWDFEAELAVVIGTECAGLRDAAEARRAIFGYTVLNDVCLRDVPPERGTLSSPAGKSRDTHAPLGPAVLLADTPGLDPDDLTVRSWRNGRLRQDANTAELLAPVAEIVATASRLMRLLPGDIVSTGSPAGTSLETGEYLEPGDVMRVEVARVGVLENRIIAAPTRKDPR
ncbi:fumarylacetoacetate hydrolase family protein [Micromonospora sp. WMMD1082]|uniref:fumarylacetoacetate hydrolase family protein n=1 Tax=Micromonospora sp. WMMD1082 TaxID=3016104 RepID=UPI0024162C9F|nr:fumarylacetoacetate hydrolase family protein [Micromonospora sp. WMMD1082]MDG4798360.1 fumarylacetoacetate hydrolase family protein [Micromonospora sp. WMMD1082]